MILVLGLNKALTRCPHADFITVTWAANTLLRGGYALQESGSGPICLVLTIMIFSLPA